jgi:hypothetical protein
MATSTPKVPQNGPAFTAFMQHLTARREEQFAALVEHYKRASVAARRRKRLFDKIAKATGVDVGAIEKLHAKEWETVRQPSARQKRDAARLAKLERNCQRIALKTINKNRGRFEYKKGNPHTSICNWRTVVRPSVTVNPQTFNQGVVNIASQIVGTNFRPGENFLRIRVNVGAAHVTHDPGQIVPAAAVDIFTTHHFQTTVPHDGVLSVVANYAPAGNIFLSAPGDCIFPGSAGADVTLFMFVSIEKPDGDIIELPTGAETKIIDRSLEATCDSKSTMIHVGTQNGVAYQLAHDQVVEVEQGDIVHVRAGIEIFMGTGAGGFADAIFTPAPFGLNVPMVLIKVES